MPTHSTSEELNAWRTDLLERFGNFSDLAKQDWPTLCKIELFPGSKLGDRIITVPEEYLPPGSMRRLSSRQRDPLIGNALIAGAISDAVARQREENVRRALLVLWLPHDGKRGDQGLGPSSWLTSTGIFLRTLRHLLPLASGSLVNIWLRQKHLPASVPLISRCQRTCSDIHTIFRRLERGAERGLIPDFVNPAANVKPGAIEESHRQDKDEQKPARAWKISPSKDDDDKHFDDRFVIKIIGRALWIVEHIAEQCIECWRLLEELEQENPTLSREQLKNSKNKMISEYPWNIDSLKKIPFHVKQRINRQRYEFSDQWPPPNLSSLLLMIRLIQALAFTLTAFCTAARHHEISGAKPTVAFGARTRMRSVTRKTERAFGGRERDWPLHPIAARALALQEQLAAVIRPKDQSHLWVQLQNYQGSGKGGPLANMTEPMVAAVEHLGLENASDGRPHAHRWRHTLVRLIALAIVQSMQVLQDLLGHDDLESLLHYLLSVPDLVAEVMQVAEEASQLVVRTAVEETVHGRTGGGAAPSLRDGLTGMAMRRGIDVLGTDNIEEAVRILAGRGLQCTLVLNSP